MVLEPKSLFLLLRNLDLLRLFKHDYLRGRLSLLRLVVFLVAVNTSMRPAFAAHDGSFWLAANAIAPTPPESETSAIETAIARSESEASAITPSESEASAITPSESETGAISETSMTETAGPSTPPNVVLLVIDTLRGDFVWSPERTSPTGLARTARALGDCVLFTNCQSQSSWTRPSMCTLFTGLYPTAHGVLRGYGADERGGDSDGEEHRLRDSMTTLAEVLKDAGYRTFAIQTNPHLAMALGVAQGFDHYLFKNDAPGSWVTDTALERIRRTSRARVGGKDAPPFFAYLHYLDPHMPYLWHQDIDYPVGTAEHGIGMERMLEGGLTAPEIEQQRRLYRGEVEAVDRHVARFLTELSKDPRWASTIVVITSDHGEEFWEHGGFEHGHSLYDELLRVPLLIGGPALAAAPRLVNEQVRLLDLMPTLLDLCGVSRQSAVGGSSDQPPFYGPSLATAAPAPTQETSLALPFQLPLMQGESVASALPLPPMQGTSFASALRTAAAVKARVSFAEGILYGEQRWSYRDARSKRILRLVSGGTELFELASDPAERSNLLLLTSDSAERPSSLPNAHSVHGPPALPAVARAAEIDALLRQWQSENRAISEKFGPMQSPLHDSEQRERLRSLGYIR